MREIKLTSVDSVKIGHGGSALWKRNAAVLSPLVAVCVVFMLWSASMEQSMTSIVAQVEHRPPVTVSRRGPSECLKHFDKRRLWTKHLDSFQEPPCQAILEDNGDVADTAKEWMPSSPFDDQSLLRITTNCTLFRSMASFPDNPNSDEEAAFPMAYVITAQEDAAQTLRFLRNVYWPQNSYCFALAPDAPTDYRMALHFAAECFNGNVLVAGSREQANVTDSQTRFGFLQNIADCFRLLTETRGGHPEWNYVQIVSSEDFPLKTNLQLVNVLALFNGSNDAEMAFGNPEDYYEDQNSPINGTEKTVPPEGLILFSGAIESTLSRGFVQFLVSSELSKSLLNWLNGTSRPELYYLSTMMHNIILDQPGGFPGSCLWFWSIRLDKKKKRAVSRIKIWDVEYAEERTHCRNVRGFLGGDARSVCKAGVRDVAWYIEQPHLMAHRFESKHEPAALYCLEKWHWKKTCEKLAEFDTSFYDTDSVRFVNTMDKENFLC